MSRYLRPIYLDFKMMYLETEISAMKKYVRLYVIHIVNINLTVVQGKNTSSVDLFRWSCINIFQPIFFINTNIMDDPSIFVAFIKLVVTNIVNIY